MKRRTLSSTLFTITDGIVGTVTNLVLPASLFSVSMGGIKTMGDADRVAYEVHEMLDTVNYDTIKRTIYILKNRVS